MTLISSRPCPLSRMGRDGIIRVGFRGAELSFWDVDEDVRCGRDGGRVERWMRSV